MSWRLYLEGLQWRDDVEREKIKNVIRGKQLMFGIPKEGEVWYLYQMWLRQIRRVRS